MDIEKLLEKDELQREKDVDNELDQKLEMERKKQECLQKAIKEKRKNVHEGSWQEYY